ncbi:hypothetical protein D3C85_1425140 [compost metagenome]
MTISTTTLKNAAFAIECDLWTDPATGANYLAKDGAILRRWEPIRDDGDAFRLAVALKITIEFGHCSIASYKGFADSANLIHAHSYERHDPNELVRMSIVMAASYIGAAL